MKPLGMDPLFNVHTPTRAMDMIWDAVEEAIHSGMTAKEFREEAAQAWEHELKQRAKEAAEDLRR